MNAFSRIIFIISIIILCTSFVKAQSAIGVIGGLSNMKFTGDQPTKGWFGVDKGYGLGLSYSYRFSQVFSLGTSLNYTVSKAAYRHADTFNVEVDTMNLKLKGYTLPIDAVVWSKNGRFYVFTGLEFFFASSFTGENRFGQELKFEDQMRDVNIFAHFGAGFIIPIGKPHLFCNVRYSQGLTDLNNAHNSEDSYLPRTKMFAWKLKFGIVIPLKDENHYSILK